MEDRLPTETEIVNLHKKYAPSEEIFNRIYGHCEAVWQVAEQLIAAKKLPVDQELVKASCLLLDIGIYKLVQPDDIDTAGYVGRGVASEELLREEGLPAAVCDIVARHVGHALTAERIKATYLPLPARDLSPRTDEERLVNYVSKLHIRSDKPRFTGAQTYLKFLRKYGDSYDIDDFQRMINDFGEPDTNALNGEQPAAPEPSPTEPDATSPHWP